jgi:hypothetical protein
MDKTLPTKYSERKTLPTNPRDGQSMQNDNVGRSDQQIVGEGKKLDL